MPDKITDLTDRPREDAWIRLSLGAFIALLFGIVLAFMLEININLGGLVSMLIAAGFLLLWAARHSGPDNSRRA